MIDCSCETDSRYCYARALGQRINFAKSIILFSLNQDQDRQSYLNDILIPPYVMSCLGHLWVLVRRLQSNLLDFGGIRFFEKKKVH